MIYSPEQIIKKLEMYKGDRGNWETQWQEIGDWIIPRKSDVNRFTAPGSKKGVNILDNTGMQACELLAGALHGLITNPAGEFFELTTGDEDLDNHDRVRIWRQDTTTRMHNKFNNSNFQTEVHEFYLDLCGFCTASMTVMEDPILDVVFQSHFLKEIYICENNKGNVDEIYRCYWWDARKIIQEFGAKDLPKAVLEAYEGGKNTLFEIVHVVYPNEPDIKFSGGGEYAPKSGKSFKFPIVSQKILVKEKHQLQIKGFNEMPWIVSRWAKASGEAYGRGPGMNALPEVKMVNLMEDVIIRGAQKIVDPPLQLPDDGFILPIKTRPGGINFRRAGSSSRDGKIEPVFNNAQIDFGEKIMESRRQRIREAFYVDQLQLGNQNPQMTATEVTDRRDERLKFLGPLVGRLQVEFLTPLIERTFAIMERRKRFLPLPPELKGKPLNMRFSSVIAKMQRINEAQNIQRTLQALAPFVQIDSSIVDNFDGDKALKGICTIYSFPQRFLRNQDEIEDIRTQRQKAQMAAAKQQQEMHNAEVMDKTVPAAAQAAEAVQAEEGE